MLYDDWKNFDEWLDQVPNAIIDDPLWDFKTYQKALFFSDLDWRDCEKMLNHPIGKHLISQLIRSADSVPANIEEGYSCGYGKDYARFLRISGGSAREARGWYFRNRRIFDPKLVEHRIELATELSKNLTITSLQQRKYKQTKTND